jgi:glycosyltransferase involved in cell wall biosynthesis
MRTRVTLHRFSSDQSLPQRDGVNLAHTEINALLTGETAQHLAVEFHDFDRLLRDETYALAVLRGVDCVLSNVGPHAHYYHLLRERLGLDFRIVRDIKTALWSCYLLQESLCEPFLRPGDALLATSNYSRQLTRHLFAHLHDHPIALFEPVLTLEPFVPSPRTPGCDPVVTLGHVGRLSEDKNFPQMVDLLLALDRVEPGRYRLVACGSVHSPTCEPGLVAQRIQRETGRGDLFTYLPPIPHQEVLALLRRFDYFLFFSTSNLEVLGRVLVECAYAGVPVLTGDHAAASELVDGSSLLPVSYERARVFHTHFDAPLGRVDVEAAAQRIRYRQPVNPAPAPQMNQPKVLLDLLRDGPDPAPLQEEPPLSEGPADFVRRLRWRDLTRARSAQQALATMVDLRDWFCALNGKSSPDFNTRLQHLRNLSRFPERTERFARAAASTRGDFTNLGGLDMELCNVAGFHPSFWLSEA